MVTWTGIWKRVVRQELLKTRKIPKSELLEKKRNHQEENKLTLNITNYLAFQNTKTLSEEWQIPLVPEKEHQKLFPNVTITGFCNGKSLEDHLVRALLSILNSTWGTEWVMWEKKLSGLQMYCKYGYFQPSNNKWNF